MHVLPRPAASSGRTRAVLGATTVLLLLALMPLSTALATSALQTPAPVFLRAAVTTPGSGTIAIHGDGFTPGGLVFIDVSARGNADLHAGAWVVASRESWGPPESGNPAHGYTYTPAGTVTTRIELHADAVYGPNGSQDPAQGYEPGLDDASVLAALCSQSLDIQAYDLGSQAWSNRVEMTASDVFCASAPATGAGTSWVPTGDTTQPTCMRKHLCESPF